jgi:hypothetical protein
MEPICFVVVGPTRARFGVVSLIPKPGASRGAAEPARILCKASPPRGRSLEHARSPVRGIESLGRSLRREPPRRVHECVFGPLAMESEPGLTAADGHEMSLDPTRTPRAWPYAAIASPFEEKWTAPDVSRGPASLRSLKSTGRYRPG